MFDVAYDEAVAGVDDGLDAVAGRVWAAGFAQEFGVAHVVDEEFFTDTQGNTAISGGAEGEDGEREFGLVLKMEGTAVVAQTIHVAEALLLRRADVLACTYHHVRLVIAAGKGDAGNAHGRFVCCQVNSAGD